MSLRVRVLFPHQLPSLYGLGVIEGTEEVIWFDGDRGYRLSPEEQRRELYRKQRFEKLIGFTHSFDKPKEERVQILNQSKDFDQRRREYYEFNEKRLETKNLQNLGPIELITGEDP